MIFSRGRTPSNQPTINRILDEVYLLSHDRIVPRYFFSIEPDTDILQLTSMRYASFQALSRVVPRDGLI